MFTKKSPKDYKKFGNDIVRLEPSVGFLHDFSDYQTKQSLVYDLQEPFRWLCDLTKIEAIESEIVDLKDFYYFGNCHTSLL